MPSTKPTRHDSRRSARHTKAVNLALQGGGAHGAFTWGVLDRLFEDDRIWIEAISGTSAGAMNALVAAQGMYENGAEGARSKLHAFWQEVSRTSRGSPIQRSVMAHLTGNWSLDDSPGFQFFNMLQRVASPYDLNPLGVNPLRALLESQVDFKKVRACQDMDLFISATNVETGRVRVFQRGEITLEAAIASACLPFLFKAIEIDGQHYWDGGYMGNPPLFPFFHNSPSDDIVIVQINPVVRPGVPRSAQDIQDRVSEITFNSALLHELRAIDFVSRLNKTGRLDRGEYRDMKVHIIQDRRKLRALGASSKLNAEWAFLEHLFDIGRAAAERWLAAHFDDLGVRSSVDLGEMFQGVGILPDGT